MNLALTANELSFKNVALTKATNAIIKARNSAVSSYLTIGEKLKEIRDSKLYKEDFEKFEDFTAEVFGLSKSTAYRMIAVTTRFLIPEKTANVEKFFTGFEDTALAALLNVPISTESAGKEIDIYAETKDFCAEHYIDTTTPVSEIRQIIKEAKKTESLNGETAGSETEAMDTDAEPAEPEIVCLSDVQQEQLAKKIDEVFSYLKAAKELIRGGHINAEAIDVINEVSEIIAHA